MAVDFHFLNVGPGDCTIVHFPHRKRHDGKNKNERIMMVDIYHHEDDEECENIIEYYKQNFSNPDGSVKPIFRFVCTHPHQDHICGLKKLLYDNDIRILNFWDLNHSFKPEDFDGHPTHEDDWEAYETLKSEDSPATVIRTKREDTPAQFWNDDEDRIAILSPSKSLIHHAHYKEDGEARESHKVEIDEMSYALLIRVNKRKVILAGDGRDTPCWNDIFENCKSDIKDVAVLKAGHHGHEASFHEDAIQHMNPDIIIFSNSIDQDDENGAEELYEDTCPESTIYKTCDHGTILVRVPFDESESITIN